MAHKQDHTLLALILQHKFSVKHYLWHTNKLSFIILIIVIQTSANEKVFWNIVLQATNKPSGMFVFFFKHWILQFLHMLLKGRVKSDGGLILQLKCKFLRLYLMFLWQECIKRLLDVSNIVQTSHVWRNVNRMECNPFMKMSGS